MRTRLVSAMAGILLGTLPLACSTQPVDDGVHLSAIDTNIFKPQCTLACHSGGAFAAGGLDMRSDLHASLVGMAPVAAVCVGSPMRRVVPGDPAASILYVKIEAKIEGKDPPCGDGMPAGVERPAMSREDADLIREWIERGAVDD